MLAIEGFTAGYRKDYPIIEDIDLIVKDGERIAITGRNGAGKTTFARAVMQLTPFSRGKLEYNGESLLQLPLHRYVTRGIAYFIQDGVVFPNLTLQENLWMAQKAGRISQQENYKSRYQSFMGNIMDKDLLKQKAGNLSGGERNFLSLAMALSSEPSLLILDEPFAGISPNNIPRVKNLLKHYLEDTSGSMILIDQNLDAIRELCTKTYILRDKNLSLN